MDANEDEGGWVEGFLGTANRANFTNEEGVDGVGFALSDSRPLAFIRGLNFEC